MSDIVVIGSLNMDIVVRAERMPEAGETILGSDFGLIAGGKGANQAAAAARMGAGVSMVGRVGSDPFGETLRRSLSDQGVDVSHVRVDQEAGTGTAFIVVDAAGENRIIIAAGANGYVGAEDLREAQPLIAAAGAVVLQFEVPLETVEQAIRIGRDHQTPIILNPAPAYEVPLSFLYGVGILVMNETESEIITGIAVSDGMEAAQDAADLLRREGVQTVIITLGAKGALVAGEGDMEQVPGYPVEAVDTTAAGDAFVGALAASVARGKPLAEAVRVANAAGALTVTRFGAQPSLPTAQEVEAFLAGQR